MAFFFCPACRAENYPECCAGKYCWADYRQHRLHRHGSGRRRPWRFRPHICDHQFQRERQLRWYRHSLQCRYSHRDLAGDAQCRGDAGAAGGSGGSRAGNSRTDRDRPCRTWIQPKQEGLISTRSVDDGPAAPGFVISGPCRLTAPRHALGRSALAAASSTRRDTHRSEEGLSQSA